MNWTGKGSQIEKKERKKKEKKKAKVPTLRYGGSFGSQETQAQAGAFFPPQTTASSFVGRVECASREESALRDGQGKGCGLLAHTSWCKNATIPTSIGGFDSSWVQQDALRRSAGSMQTLRMHLDRLEVYVHTSGLLVWYVKEE